MCLVRLESPNANTTQRALVRAPPSFACRYWRTGHVNSLGRISHLWHIKLSNAFSDPSHTHHEIHVLFTIYVKNNAYLPPWFHSLSWKWITWENNEGDTNPGLSSAAHAHIQAVMQACSRLGCCAWPDPLRWQHTKFTRHQWRAYSALGPCNMTI